MFHFKKMTKVNQREIYKNENEYRTMTFGNDNDTWHCPTDCTPWDGQQIIFKINK